MVSLKKRSIFKDQFRREGMLEYQEDQKGLSRANLLRERLEHKILWRGPKIQQH